MDEEPSKHHANELPRAHAEQLTLHVDVLGIPDVRLEDTALHFRTKKTLALLLYLAVTGTPQPREQLAALFWPDTEETRGRATLRSTLRLLRQSLTDGFAEAIKKASDGREESARERRAATHATELLLRSGHDRLGRDCLWIERSPRTPSPTGDAPEMTGAQSVGGVTGNGDVTVRLDLDTLEQGAALAARLTAQRAPVQGAVSARPPVEELRRQQQVLTIAATAYRGTFLAGFDVEDSDGFTDWTEQQRAYWQGRMDRVFDALSRVQVEGGAFTAALETAARWVERNPLEEAGYRRLMEAHAAAGDRTAALATYSRCRGTLARTLGVEPAPETVALAERIRRQAAGAERPEGSGESVRSRGASTLAPASGARPAVPHMQPLDDSSLLALPLAGREAEFFALVAAFERARQGAATAVVIEGAGGIGKTRLAVEFVRWAAQTRGAEVLRGQAFEAGGRLPYQALVEALRRRLERERAPDDLLDDVWLVELSRLLPELRERYPDLAAPEGGDNVAAERLFEAVAQLGLALTGRMQESGKGASQAPLVLFLDDAQWTDVGTRDLVRFVVRRWREAGAPVMALLTVRSEDLGTHDELRDWLRELAREVGETEMSTIALGALEADTLHRLLEELTVEDIVGTGDGGAPDLALPALSTLGGERQAPSQTIAHLAQRLHAETGGQPLYLVQMLRMLTEQGVLAWEERDVSLPAMARTSRQTSARWQLRVQASPQEIDNLGRLLPASMRAVVQQRLERLNVSTRHFLMAGAVLGTRFRPEQAWTLADLDEATGLDALEEAERHLVMQVEPGGGSGGETCQFTHDKLREVIYTETGAVRRRVLHRRAYELLEHKGARAAPADLAHHALLAGLREPALRASVAAGDVALAVYAVRDAIRYYEQARRLLTEGWSEEGGQLPTEGQERLYTQLGRAYEWIGAWEEARSAYQALRLHARERGDHILEGMALLRLALTAWQSYDDLATAQALAREALAMAEATGDTTLQAEAEWTVGQVATIAGEVDVALRHARRAVELARTTEAPELIARSLVRIAITDIFSGAWDEGVVAASEARACYAALAEKMLEEKARAGPTMAITTPALQTQEMAARWAFGGSLPATAAAHRAMEATALSVQAFGEICRGDLQAGVEVGQMAWRLARDSGSAYAQLYCGYTLPVGLVEVGAYEEGLLVARQGLAAARVDGDPLLTLNVLTSLAYMLHALRQIEEASSALEEALALAEQAGVVHSWGTARPLAYRCANRALAGDWPGSAAAALQAMSLRDAAQARLLFFDFARHYETEALLRAGETERARADMERLAARLRPKHPDRHDRRYQLVLLRMRAVLARFEGQSAEAITHLEAALRLAEEMSLPGEQWQLQAELAGLRRVSGDATGATAAQARAEAIVAALAEHIDDIQLQATYVRATSQALRVPLG